MANNIFTRPTAFLTRWTIAPERRDEFVEIVRRNIRDNGALYGDIANFIFYGWSRDPNVWISVESFSDETKLAEFRESEKFKDLVKSLFACCVGRTEIELFCGMEGDPTVFDAFPKGPSRAHPDELGHGLDFL